jgi:hypothetical protein
MYLGRYLDDFKYILSENVTLSAEVVYKESNLELCSLTCVTADGFVCNSFYYCPESKSCLLNSGYAQQVSNTDAPKDLCGLYNSKNI